MSEGGGEGEKLSKKLFHHPNPLPLKGNRILVTLNRFYSKPAAYALSHVYLQHSIGKESAKKRKKNEDDKN